MPFTDSLEPLVPGWSFRIEAIDHERGLRTKTFSFRTYDDDGGRFRRIRGEIVLPEGPGPFGLVAAAPILGGAGTDYSECRWFASGAADRGWATYWLHQDVTLLEPQDSGHDLESMLRSWVVAMRQALELLLVYEPVDELRLGLFGISLGAIRAVPLIAVEPRFDRAVLCLAGADLPRIIGESVEGLVVGYREERAQRLDVSEDAVIEDLSRWVRTDAINYAPAIASERVLLILARFDRHVPTERGWDLYQLLGRPDTRVTPLGHYTSILLWSWMMGHALEFLTVREEL